jgi:DNA-binding PadR family transcriptional regulator
MAKSTVNIRYLVLGLLTQKPMTGYDIKGLLESFSWLIGSPSYGSLYPALHGLLDDELVALKVESNEEKPSRKVYRITEAGHEALKQWIDKPVVRDPSLKAFLMHLILADNYPREGLIAYLNQRHSQVMEQRAALREMLENDDLREETLQQPLAMQYGLAMANMELQWLENTLEELT